MEYFFKKIVKFKIKKDSSNYFSHEEIEIYSNDLSLDVSTLINLLNLKLSPRRKPFFYSKLYQEKKEKYFSEHQEKLMEKIIICYIKRTSSNTFSLIDLEYLEREMDINSADISKYILKSNKYDFLVRGDYRSLVSNCYKEIKQRYLRQIQELIILEIIKLKSKTDYSKIFTFNEITFYSSKYNINLQDFLVHILEIKKYEGSKISSNTTFSSDLYKRKKEEFLLESKNTILEKVLMKRIRETSSYSFDRNCIINLSIEFGINIRDFIVFILGKSDQLYHDFKASRIETINSQDYYELKKKHVLTKRTIIFQNLNSDKRIYFTLSDIQVISQTLDINIDDIILHFFGKTKKNLYNLKNKYRNRQKISFGEYKSGRIPNYYVEKNFTQIKNIVEISVKSVFKFFKMKNYEVSNLYEDLIQEGFLYLVERGNPLSNNIYMINDVDTNYHQDHGKILYTKCFYFLLTRIQEILKYKEKSGEVYDDTVKMVGDTQNYNNIEILDFIKNITNDVNLQKILSFFALNSFSEENITIISQLIRLSEEQIILYLKEAQSLFDLNEFKLTKVLKKA